MKGLISKWIAVLAFVGWAGAANATPLTYSIDGIGSGVLNGTAFTGAAFRIDLVGDTADFASTANFDAVDPLVSAIVSITGLPAATLNIATRLGISTGAVVFFSRSESIGGLDLMDFSIGSFVDLTVPFGPVPNTAAVYALGQFQNVDTSAGLLSFDAVRSVLFAGNGETPVPAPVPATLALLGLGLAGLGWSKRKSV